MPTIRLRCAACDALVTKSPSQVKGKHGSTFCSRACHYKGRSLGLTKRVVTKPYVYTPEGKAAMLASSNTPKGQRAFHPAVCAMCSTGFDDPNDGRARATGLKFCSLDCCNAYRKGDRNPAWRGGHPKYYGPDWRPLRRAARDRDGHKCRRCAAPSPAGKYHDVHHIKPVSTFENPNDANTMDNVVTLCHSCHMLVEWHGIDFDMGTSANLTPPSEPGNPADTAPESKRPDAPRSSPIRTASAEDTRCAVEAQGTAADPRQATAAHATRDSSPGAAPASH